MILTNFKYLRLRKNLSEEALASRASLSRLTLRQIEAGDGNPTLQSLERLSVALDRELCVMLLTKGRLCDSEVSTVAVSLKAERDGFESWPIHFMELVDAFRKTMDLRLFLLPPVSLLDTRLEALLASIVCHLCAEVVVPEPAWARRSFFLSQPWFPSQTESLKAMAIRESPLAFRRNNIFVCENFLARA